VSFLVSIANDASIANDGKTVYDEVSLEICEQCPKLDLQKTYMSFRWVFCRGTPSPLMPACCAWRGKPPGIEILGIDEGIRRRKMLCGGSTHHRGCPGVVLFVFYRNIKKIKTF